jgi:hypothetical protein
MIGIWTLVRLALDIVSIKLFVRLLGRDGELLDSHLFFYDRYSDLADYYRSRGRLAKADRFAAIAEAHYRLAPDDDDGPKAAAMGMPIPRTPLKTNAVSTSQVRDRGSETPSSLVTTPAG